eukprot:CAMPEP_0181440582 /NCGR_PEP_ID=MMETSP1110-20121109/23045_1 /TAXON_ID=174948 /ORGANISM="Symbiodinium sp., Strain CCMP421" /LENGTH=36 /DNA_ID= /DNA_START= /DNA_END= /DNA_ORIENTATION=
MANRVADGQAQEEQQHAAGNVEPMDTGSQGHKAGFD